MKQGHKRNNLKQTVQEILGIQNKKYIDVNQKTMLPSVLSPPPHPRPGGGTLWHQRRLNKYQLFLLKQEANFSQKGKGNHCSWVLRTAQSCTQAIGKKQSGPLQSSAWETYSVITCRPSQTQIWWSNLPYWRLISLAIKWSTWKERNRRIFKGKPMHFQLFKLYF